MVHSLHAMSIYFPRIDLRFTTRPLSMPITPLTSPMHRTAHASQTHLQRLANLPQTMPSILTADLTRTLIQVPLHAIVLTDIRTTDLQVLIRTTDLIQEPSTYSEGSMIEVLRKMQTECELFSRLHATRAILLCVPCVSYGTCVPCIPCVPCLHHACTMLAPCLHHVCTMFAPCGMFALPWCQT